MKGARLTFRPGAVLPSLDEFPNLPGLGASVVLKAARIGPHKIPRKFRLKFHVGQVRMAHSPGTAGSLPECSQHVGLREVQHVERADA